MAQRSPIQQQDRIIRPKELKAIIGLSQVTIWRREKEGSFPKRRRISPGAVGWLWSEIRDWMEDREICGGER